MWSSWKTSCLRVIFSENRESEDTHENRFFFYFAKTEIICLTNRIFMVFSLAFGGLILLCNGSLTLNLLCISDCYVIHEGTWWSRGRGMGDFIIRNPHYLVSRSCIVTLLPSCHSFLLTLANTFVSALGIFLSFW